MKIIQDNNPWIDTRLTEEEMNFLWSAISEENKENWTEDLAGNISKSELLKDKDNWFYETVLKKPTERLFYDDWQWNNYRKTVGKNEDEKPKFKLTTLWVNYQKKHEFNPVHYHNEGSGYSFVVFMKIPTHWKEQHALPISVNSTSPAASDFQFMWSEKDKESIHIHSFALSPEDEGRILFFPAWLNHQVYPFYECDEERITISGNIILKIPNKQEVPLSVYKEKKLILEAMENSVKVTKRELKQMKREMSDELDPDEVTT